MDIVAGLIKNDRFQLGRNVRQVTNRRGRQLAGGGEALPLGKPRPTSLLLTPVTLSVTLHF